MKTVARTLASAVVLSSAVSGLAAGTQARADTVRTTTHRPLDAQARTAGLTTAGGGYPGWARPTTTAPQAKTLAAPRLVANAQKGIDVSRYQGNVNWASWAAKGVTWAYTKATEGTYLRNPYFASQYNGAYKQGLIRGAYHFANPATSSAKAQAEYFVANGGGWSADGKTLPGMLDIENNPYGPTCYGLTKTAMVQWIRTFAARYKQLTSRDVVIYTNSPWWSLCTGNTTAFRLSNPLWIAAWTTNLTSLPGGWPTFTYWQYTDTPIDQDYFNGSYTRLKVLARNHL
ncbi:GH25 family lysozyme [Branchiibius sp. NY16-3462-2]|uniref:GH25 family lysozyme n=1 Tax=Branchiibius sp. NY16-3462-2 TaxID=1807500 RepID=UPI00079789AF|nr:GH25 family lysozyme [Branchiibius sp. NY16-3462-2]KYH45394.1 lysozyme [Branchiibius sp. NY16-3462-2]